MLPPINWPNDLDAERFIREYWQRKPLLIRNAFSDFENPLSADELAGLACEEGITSRLVLESRGTKPWELRQGPFDESIFDWLGTEGWSLMITDLEKALPDFRSALTPFRFIPDWRIDDLMASFAPPGGSVGPHYDAYDVFLFQAQGRRRWLIGPEPPEGFHLREGLDLKIIESPQFTSDYELAPGDMLYLPPRYAHHGIALDPCITWSFGFRAPAIGDLAVAWGDAVAASLPDDLLYQDPDFTPATSPGEITASARAALRQQVADALACDAGAFDLFIGQHLTDRAADLALQSTPLDTATLKAACQSGHALHRHPDIRFAYVASQDHATLFAGGVALTTHEQAAIALCEQVQWENDSLRELLDVAGATELLIALGALGFVEMEPYED